MIESIFTIKCRQTFELMIKTFKIGADKDYMLIFPKFVMNLVLDYSYYAAASFVLLLRVITLVDESKE